MILEAIYAIIVLFVPGIVLLCLPQVKRWVPASALEKVVIGSAAWNSFFIFVGYFVSIASDSVLGFFGIFAVLSVVILAYGTYEGIRRFRKVRFGIGGSLENLPFAIVVFAFSLFVLSLVLAHSIYQEYDALFYYMPLAKSILLTGGLRFDFYHQTVLTTSIEPAMPLTYAFAGFLAGGQSQIASASRLIPFAYVCLTCAAVYLAGKEVTRKALVGLASAGLFLAIPVTSTVASKFSLYLDVSFVFFVALILYSVVKVYTSGQENSVWWWLILGLSLTAALFERDITYFIFLPVLAILALLFLRSRGGPASTPVTIASALLFAGAYNLFFVSGLLTSPQDLQSLLADELPVVVVMLLFFFLASTHLEGLKAPQRRTLLYAACPLVLVLLLLARNILEASSITSNLPISNPTLREALLLLAQGGRTSASALNFIQPFRWDTLFNSLQLGGLFLIPTAIGLVVVVRRVAGRGTEMDERALMFIFISSFLSMLLVWSWLFDSSFVGPEVRRLYYFAPFVAILGGIGLVSVTDRLEPTSARLRIPLFLAVTVAYFLFKETGVSWNLVRVSSVFSNLGELSLSLLLGLSAIFVLSLYPLSSLVGDAGGTAALKRGSVTKAVAVLLILISSSFIAYNSAGVLSNEAQTANTPPAGWENDLASVAQYLNNYQNNSYGIVSTGGLPLAYLTSHTIIDSTTYFGMESLLSMNKSSSGNLANDLLSSGIHYLLVPTPANSFYSFFTSLGENFSVMNQAVIDQTPNLVLIQSFDKYELYLVMPDQTLPASYAFLPSWHMTNGSAVELLEPPLSSRGSVTFYYLGALMAPTG